MNHRKINYENYENNYFLTCFFDIQAKKDLAGAAVHFTSRKPCKAYVQNNKWNYVQLKMKLKKLKLETFDEGNS